MDNTFFDGHDELYHRAKFGKDRTTRAGCRCENVVFVFFCWSRSKSVTYLLTVRSRGAQFEQALRCRLLPDFNEVFSVFFIRDSSFRCTTFVARWRHNFREIAVKNCEKSKNRRKGCAHHFVQIAIDLKKIPRQYFRWVYVDVHLYKKFCARPYLALTTSVKIRIGSPRTARNEQVFAHQTSYNN